MFIFSFFLMRNLLPFRTRRRRLGLLLLAYIVYPLAMMASVVLQGSVFAQIVQAVLMILGTVGVLWITQGKLTKQHLSLQATNGRQVLGWSVIGFVVLQLCVFVREKWVPGAYVSPVDQFKALGFGVSVLRDMLTMVSIGLLVPIAEELIFRGAMFRVIRDRLYKTGKMTILIVTVIAAIIASIMFMQAHLSGAMTMASMIYVIMSLIFVIVYVQTGSLRTAIMVHVLNNSFALGQIIFSSSTGSLTQPWTAYLLVLLPVVAWMLCQGVDKILPDQKAV